MSRLSSFASRAPRFWQRPSVLAILLQPFAYIFQAIVALRRSAFRRGILAQQAVPAPVVVVGNITVGGTGKTPLVAWLARQLSEAGYKPGIVSRGYGGRANRHPVMVTQASQPAEVGDEPLILVRQTKLPVCICVDRVAAARHLLAEADVNIVISDDGLQHYRLARDLEFAVLDGERMLGNGRLLPAGPLREPPGRLAEVDRVFINGRGDFPAAYCFTLTPGDALALDSSRARSLHDFSGAQVWAVAGIGNPARFHKMLASFDIEPVGVDVPDHGTVSLQSLRSKAPHPILMTEKDAVKYLSDPVADTWYVPVTVNMPQSAQEAVMNLIRTIAESRATSE
jgi:tetraacyldisaccharide 4'-kinase